MLRQLALGPQDGPCAGYCCPESVLRQACSSRHESQSGLPFLEGVLPLAPRHAHLHIVRPLDIFHGSLWPPLHPRDDTVSIQSLEKIHSCALKRFSRIKATIITSNIIAL